MPGHQRRHPIRHATDAHRIGMHPVGQHQLAIADHALQDERVQHGVMLAREVGPDAVEATGEIRSEVGRRHHAGQDDRDASPLQFLQHGRHVRARFGRVDLTQHVIAAQTEQHQIGRRLQPIEGIGQPTPSAGSGVARYPGIDHRRIDPLPAQPRLDRIGQALAALQAIPRIQAVTKGQHRALRPGHRQGRRSRWRRGRDIGNRQCLVALRIAGRQQRGLDKRGACHIWRLRHLYSGFPENMVARDMVIRAADVRLTLGGAAPVEILKGIDLAVADGESLALLGASGSGKSSLMAVLAGLERATSGRVEVAGTDFGTLDEDGLAIARRGRIGIVLQAFHLLPTMTALENVAVPMELAGERDAFARAEAELAAVGLSHRLDHYPAQLSGGEQQRVAIARALGPRPRIVFADEPTGNLDAATGARVMDLLFDRRAATSATLVIITHDPALARRCDRVIELADGRIAA